ncbi:DHA2 family efflux MFS transporter permease subunit [Actinosynnema sp. NPDC023658]|uniref:DHA2 family efflux MFS transporter permease subunit n=1 Tax=Actinosynnema sp. NPDC023658 TaxID=3155465 RepID=UPI0033F506C5
MDANGTKASMTSAQRWVLTLVSVASLMVVLDGLVVMTALNTIRIDLGASIDQLEWTVNAFTLSFAILLMPAAALGDRVGRKRLFLVGLGLFTLASVACALAPSSGLLITARATQGIGSAMVMPEAMALLSVAFPPPQRAKALGVFSSVTGLGTLGGPLVGGAVTQGLDWQWIFWLNVPIGLVLIPLAAARIEESRGAARRLDFGGLALVTLGAFGLVWGLIRSNAVGWASLEVSGMLVAGAVLLIAFVLWELRVNEPMLPMRFFRSAAFSAGNLSGFLLYAATFGSVFFLAQFLHTTLGYGPLAAGIRLAPWTAAVFVVSWFAGAMINRIGERPLIVGGLVLQAVGYGWISLIAAPDLDYPAMILPFMIAGCGISLAMPAAQNAVIGAVPPAAVGAAAGVFNTLRQLGGSFGIAILAVVFATVGSYASPEAFSVGFAPAMAGAAVMSVLGAIAGLWTPRRREPGTPAPGAAVPVQQARS